MEFVDGVNLRQLLQSHRLSAEEALAIVPSLCDALQFAHDRGIVHRDIKPENLLLDQAGRVKIADSGIARMLGADPSPPAPAPTAPKRQARPATWPRNKRPLPGTADSRADIYSLGVVFYEMLTGRPAGRIQPPSQKVQIDVRLDAIVLRALEQTPERRYQAASELRTQIETVTTDVASQPPAARATPASPATFSVPHKIASCLAITPERLATFAGQFLLHRQTHQPLSIPKALTISSVHKTTRIPLEQIQDVSRGHFPDRRGFSRHFPRSRQALIHLTHTVDGQPQRLCLMTLGRRLVSRFGSDFIDVDAWCQAIRDAVEQRTGPEFDTRGVSGHPANLARRHRAAWPGFPRPRRPPSPAGYSRRSRRISQAIALAGILVGALGVLLVGRLVLGWRSAVRPSAARLVAGVLIGLAGLGLGSFRLARLNAQHAGTDALLAQEATRPVCKWLGSPIRSSKRASR